MDEEKKELNNEINSFDYYFIFWKDDIANKGISNLLKLKILETYNDVIDTNIIINLYKEISIDDIKNIYFVN